MSTMALAVAVASGVGLTTPAQAGVDACSPPNDGHKPWVTGVSVNPTTTTLATFTKHATITVVAGDDTALEVCDTDGLFDDPYASGVGSVNVRLEATTVPDFGQVEDTQLVALTLSSGTAFNGVWTGRLDLPKSMKAGNWNASAEVMDGDFNTTTYAVATATHLFLRSGLTTSVSQVANSNKVAVTGKLRHLTSSGWKASRNTRVAIYFKPKGSATWSKKATATTDKKGRYAKSLRPFKAGTWEVRYTGGQLIAASSGSDFAKMRP
jgi:hypothetical protein